VSNLSDMIEQFILEQLEDMDSIDLSRNELASFFQCAPSQINYVLSTRFSEPRGFMTTSQRGGGGYIRLERVRYNGNEYLEYILASTSIGEIDYREALEILGNLSQMGIIGDGESRILSYAISSKALSMPVKMENRQRARILHNVIINILRGNN